MKVVIANPTGLCFGVKNARFMAKYTPDPRSVTIYGEIAHNPHIQQEIQALGFQVMPEVSAGRIPATQRVLITPHGISRRQLARLRMTGKSVIDTTCPLVRRAHDAALRLAKHGCFVIVIGKSNHVEVRGIVEDLDNFDVVYSPAEVHSYPFKRLGVICQTTTPPWHAKALLNAVRERNPGADVMYIDTICWATRKRQAALISILPEIEALIVVGGRTSNNTRQLGFLARRHGIPWRQVSGPDEIPWRWLARFKVVGLAAGTSTPGCVVRSVAKCLEAFEPLKLTSRRARVAPTSSQAVHHVP